jgi:hypothetical protein
VKLEQIVFFSTSTGDAWMLDSVNRAAACLALDGAILPILIVEESVVSAGDVAATQSELIHLGGVLDT